MNWTSFNPLEYEGQLYGQKDVEFKTFLDLPAKVTPTVLEIAVSSGKTARTPYDLLRHRGWRVVDPAVVCPNFDAYRTYIETSKAEWSAAKGGYVLGQSGWFSERSACYLASGRPVVLQDTGFTHVIPSQAGLLGFGDLDGAVDAIRAIEENYDDHSDAARSLAETYFASDRVLTELVEKATRA